MADQQAGWYPDPLGDVTKLRYWDGAQWTNDYTEAVATVEPPVEPVFELVQPIESAQSIVEPVVQPVEPIQPTQAVPLASEVSVPEPAVPLREAQPVQPVEAQPFAPAQPAVPVQPMATPIPVQSAQPTPSYQSQPYASQGVPNPYATQGAPVSYTPQAVPVASSYGAPKPTKGRGLGIAALICAILGLISSFVPAINLFTSPLLLVGLVLGIISLVMARGGQGPKGLGIASIIIAVVASIITVVVTVAFVSYVESDLNSYTPRSDSTLTTPPINDSGSGTSEGGGLLDDILSGDVTGKVGEQYSTMWFDFTVESMTTASSYEGYTASSGYKLLIVHITETNTSGGSQPFGTFDWFVSNNTSDYDSFNYPLSPFNDRMMPDDFTLADKETASYDVVIEYPADLSNPYLMYIEVDENETIYTAFKIPIK